MYPWQDMLAQPSLRVLPSLGRSWRRWANWRDVRKDYGLVAAVMSTIPPQIDAPHPRRWAVHRVEWTHTQTVVISVGPVGQPALAVLKLPHTEHGVVSLRRQRAGLSALQGDPRLGDWSALLPAPLAEGEVDGQPYWIERALPGRDMRSLLYDAAARARARQAAADAITLLHRRTAFTVTVTAEMREQWIDRPLRIIRLAAAQTSREVHHDLVIQRVAAELHEALAGRTLRVGWVHGDYWASNLLVTPDGRRLLGIVDWDRAAPNELPMHDLLHLLIYQRKLLARHREPSGVIQALLKGQRWTLDERALLDAAELPWQGAEERIMVRLYWLRYAATFLAQHPERASDERWVAHNIGPVLRCL